MAEKPDGVSQSEKFRDLARQLDCDEDEGRFEEALRKIAKTVPPEPEKGSNEKPR